MNLDGAGASGPFVLDRGETGAGCPGKIVDVFGMISKCFRSVRIVDVRDQVGACAGHFVLRKGQFHVEGAEIREELRGGVEWMAVPSVLPPNANLGKPLPSHDEISFVARALDNLGELIVKRDAELH